MKVVDIAWDTIYEMEKGEFSKHAVLTFLEALTKEVAFTRAYGSYRDGKHQQKALIKHFWTVLENQLPEHK